MKRLLLLFAVVLFSSTSCRSKRPKSLSSWTACLISNAKIQRNNKRRAPNVLKATATSVLFLRTEWGRSFIASEYVAENLFIELPTTKLISPTTFTKAKGLASDYILGSQAIAFHSKTLAGTLKVVKISTSSITFLADLQAVNKLRGFSKKKSIPLRGQFKAKRYKNLRECN